MPGESLGNDQVSTHASVRRRRGLRVPPDTKEEFQLTPP